MSTPRQRSALLRGAAVGAVLLAGVVVVATVRAPSAASPAALAAAPEACSFELCEASGCDAALNPHLCVATGGCSATPWSAKGCSGETCSLGACDRPARDAPPRRFPRRRRDRCRFGTLRRGVDATPVSRGAAATGVGSPRRQCPTASPRLVSARRRRSVPATIFNSRPGDQQASDDRAGSCEHVACPAARCAPDAQQRCGATQPFQCLGGSANLGCSADAFGWVLVVETMCAACCDTRSCATAAAPSGGDPAGTG